MSTLASWLRGLGRPAVFAHRGASRRGPENSLDALRLAAREGADGVEFDVQRCASGELVVFHDRTLARCTGTLGTITETPLSVLRLLTLDRCAEHFGLPANGERIPTLEEWLATAPEGLFLNLEVKVETVAESVIAGACIDALERAGRGGHAVVSSFQPAALLRVTHRAPDRGALVESGRGWRSRLAAGILSRPAAVHPEAVLVDAARVRLWHGLGYKVATWTVDEPDELRRVLDAGVDAVITNRPDIARPIVELYRRA